MKIGLSPSQLVLLDNLLQQHWENCYIQLSDFKEINGHYIGPIYIAADRLYLISANSVDFDEKWDMNLISLSEVSSDVLKSENNPSFQSVKGLGSFSWLTGFFQYPKQARLIYTRYSETLDGLENRTEIQKLSGILFQNTRFEKFLVYLDPKSPYEVAITNEIDFINSFLKKNTIGEAIIV